jgi:hypothetical protein
MNLLMPDKNGEADMSLIKRAIFLTDTKQREQSKRREPEKLYS